MNMGVESPDMTITIHYYGGRVISQSMSSLAMETTGEPAEVFDSLLALLKNGWLVERDDGEGYDAEVPGFGPASPDVHTAFLIVTAALQGRIR